MTAVYVAGPYTAPDPCINTRAAILAADKLLALGFAPFVPHLSHFWHTMSPKAYETWLSLDLEWLTRSDALLRLPGASRGADIEVAIAEADGIPVFHSIGLLREHFCS